MKTQTISHPDISRAPIRPELVAAKLAALRNYECPPVQRQIQERPRLVEMMWFIQAMSFQPGGLAKFAEDLLATFPERIGTVTMQKAFGREYTLDERIAVWNEIPDQVRPPAGQEDIQQCQDEPDNMFAIELARLQARNRLQIEDAMRECGAEYFRHLCREKAMNRLPGYLYSICTQKTRGFGFSPDIAEEASYFEGYNEDDSCLPRRWYFPSVVECILEMMDRRAADAGKGLAMTEVARQVFDALDYAQAEKVMVRIVGPSRFGKTEALQAWCDMRPGLARLVRVPCSNSMAGLFKRIGEAMGVDCSYGSNVSRLQERVEFVIQHSGLFLVLDEAHFLIPQTYNETTAPSRLNWVRTEIVDRGLPVAIAVTPQSFDSAVSRFVKKTRYTMEQFFGRNFLTRKLPDALSKADMLAVARIHFPDMDDDAIGYIACEATLSENYLQAVAGIAKLARWKASKANRRISARDIEAAVAEVLPGRGMAATEPPGAEDASTRRHGARAPRRDSVPINGPLTAGSRAVKPATSDIAAAPDRSAGIRAAAGKAKGAFRAAPRGTKPAMAAMPAEIDLPSCSLRGTGPERAEAELISAEV